MITFTLGTGTNQYSIPMASGMWAYMLDKPPPAIAANTLSMSVYWRMSEGAACRAEIGIAAGAPVPGDNYTVRIVGATDASVAFSTTPSPVTMDVNRDVAIAYDVTADCTLWLVVRVLLEDEDAKPRCEMGSFYDGTYAGVLVEIVDDWWPTDEIGEEVNFPGTAGGLVRPLQASVTIPHLE